MFNRFLRLISKITTVRFGLSAMSKIYLLFSLLVLVAFGSCNIINPTEPIPTYIHLDSFAFTGNPALGTSSHNIKVAYVYLNNQSIGIFDLPATIPVIMDKTGVILVTPGVYQNGLTGTPVQYPYYRSDTFTLAPNPGQIFTPKLKTSYFDFTKLATNIDFEGGAGNNPFKPLTGDTLRKTTNTTQVFEGSGSGLIDFQNGRDTSESTTSSVIVLEPNVDSYIELDYKCTVPFTVGLYAGNVGTSSQYAYLVGFYPSPNKWTKAYISLRTFVSTYQTSDKNYNILLKAINDAGSNGYVLVDNIKIVTP